MLTRENLVGPWAGLPVAWTSDDQFDEQLYRQDVARCCKAGVPGIYTAGSTGEFFAMEIDEFRHVTRATCEEAKLQGTPVLIGCTSTYTLGATRRIEIAAEYGADGIQLALPYWYTVDDDWYLRFFEEVAAVVGNMAVSLYETKRAKKVLSIDQHLAVKDLVPGYMMVKSNAGTIGFTPDGCAALSQIVNVFVHEPAWAQFFPKGAVGSASSIVYWNPKVILDLWDCVKAKRWDQAAARCAKLEQLVNFVESYYGPMGYTDSAYDRLGGAATGFLKGGVNNRGPYHQPTANDVAAFQQWCREHFPEMLDLEGIT